MARNRAMARVGHLISAMTHGRRSVPLTLQSYAASAVEVTLDIGKARRELAYGPIISIADGLAGLKRAAERS